MSLKQNIIFRFDQNFAEFGVEYTSTVFHKLFGGVNAMFTVFCCAESLFTHCNVCALVQAKGALYISTLLTFLPPQQVVLKH